MIDGGDVVHELTLAAPPATVFDLFVEPAGLARWLGRTANLDPRPGGRFRFEVAPGQWCEGEYVEVDRPRRVSFTWGWTDPGMDLPPGSSLVEVDIEPDAAGARLRLVHRRLPGDLRLLHDDGWERFLARLADAAAGRPPGAYPEGDPAARRAELERDRGRP